MVVGPAVVGLSVVLAVSVVLGLSVVLPLTVVVGLSVELPDGFVVLSPVLPVVSPPLSPHALNVANSSAAPRTA